MGLLCQCPAATAISDITIGACTQSIGQIQKLVFQRKLNDSDVVNSFTIATTNPNVLATWTTVLTAADSTKAVQTPFIQGPTIEVGAPRTFGGGNQTLGGVEVITGREPTTFTAMFHNLDQLTIDQLKDYQCEKVSVFMIDEHGRIIGIADDLSSPTTFKGIPIADNSLFIGDLGLGGLEEPDMNEIRFQFLPNWSDKLYIVTPTDFDALTDLTS